jgi:hypothetical protein
VTAALDATRRCAGCQRTVLTPYCTYCGLDAHGAGNDPPVSADVAQLLRQFNVGAGFGAGFWTFANGAPILGCIYWLSLPILPPIAIGIMIYLFINGNRVALQRRRFDSIERFRRVQRIWAFAAVFPFVFSLVVCAYGVYVFTVASGV